jgi:hypothetical protein
MLRVKRGDDLQIEYVPTGYGVTTEQVKPPFHYAGWNGQHMKKSEQAGNRA